MPPLLCFLGPNQSCDFTSLSVSRAILPECNFEYVGCEVFRRAPLRHCRLGQNQYFDFVRLAYVEVVQFYAILNML
jgi:hypothetical protein